MPRRAARKAPPDQAHGLRQRFGTGSARVIALANNPFVAFTGVALERLATALGCRGVHTLVVDAADTASPPYELAGVDLAACIEPLSEQVSFLAARGLPARWIDSRGSTAGFVDALRQAAPGAGAVLLHTGVGDLRRMFAGRPFVPVVIAGTHPESVTHAYAAVKLLAQRAALVAFDLIVVAGGSGSGGRAIDPARVARHLASCSEHFLGVAMRAFAVVDPIGDVDDPVEQDLDAILTLQCRRAEGAPVEPAARPAAADTAF